MSHKVKHEVSSARFRLDATLQSLLDKKEDSPGEKTDSEDELSISEPVGVSNVINLHEYASPVKPGLTSPRKLYSPGKRTLPNPNPKIIVYRQADQKSRKRKRKEDVIETGDRTSVNHYLYVMKLFDRSVDLAQFTEATPLYPIARAWIHNGQQTPTPTPAADDDIEYNEEQPYPNVYKLPKPIRLKIECGLDQNDPRIPPLIPSIEQPLDIYADPDDGPPPEELLLRHMDRWRQIRQSWVNASRINELKYNNSMTLLKDMFERQLQGDPNTE